MGMEWLPKWAGITMSLAGFASVLIGGLASRAALVGLRPFAESEWKKAKRTYEDKTPDA